MAKILFLFPGWGRSGGARVVGEYAKGLAARGHYVRLLNNDNCMDPDWFDLGDAKCSRIHAARSAEWDIVICTNPTTVDRALIFQSPGTKMVYFVQMAENYFFLAKSQRWNDALRTYKLAANKGFEVITIGEWLERFLRQWPFQVIHQITNGVNFGEFYPVDQEPQAPYILVEGDGRNEAKDTKGYGWAIARQLRDRYGYVIKGVAAVRPATDVFDQFVLNPTVADYRALYSGAEFMLKASKYEGRSLAPLEAMACGTFTVRALRKGDEDLVHGENCLRCGYDYKALLALAFQAAEDADLRARLRASVTAYAQEHLAWEPIIDRLETLLGIDGD